MRNACQHWQQLAILVLSVLASGPASALAAVTVQALVPAVPVLAPVAEATASAGTAAAAGADSPRPALARYRCLPGNDTFAHCARSKSHAERVAVLIGQLTTQELIDVIGKRGVPRLDVPDYYMWEYEALHGVRLWRVTRGPLHGTRRYSCA